MLQYSKSQKNANMTLLQQNGSVNMTFGGTECLIGNFNQGGETKKALNSIHSPHYGHGFKSQMNSENKIKELIRFDTMQMMKSEKEKQLITDINVDLSVNLQKIKTKEEFPQLKVYAERLKDSLQAALVREKELKERVQEFDQINNQIDIKVLMKERDEFKHLYMQELRKTHQISRGGSMLDMSKKIFMTSIPGAFTPMQTNSSYKFGSTQDQFNSSSLCRPSTNTLTIRNNKTQDRQLVSLFK